MRVMELRAEYGLTAGWTYSNGSAHYSWDIPAPMGTPLHSDVAGTVRDCADGVANNTPGHTPGSGAPSNWILLHTAYKGRTASVLLNHLSPGLEVRKGDRVGAGQLLGRTGNSGNSTGPHLHVTTTDAALTGANRYAYLDNPGMVIWEPDLVLAQQQPQQPEEDQVVVIFINHKGKRYACYPAAGQKFHIQSPQQETNIANITKKAGGRVIEWAKGKDVDDPGAFGVTVPF